MATAKKNLHLFFGCLSFFLLITQYSCKPSKPKAVKRYFYYWQEDFRLQKTDSTYVFINKLNASGLYLKMLDIDWNEANHAYPVSITRNYYDWQDRAKDHWSSTDSLRDVIPVVFITNRTMLNITKDELEAFAGKIIKKCSKVTYNEMQIDCDWTEQSKDMYFDFLKALKKQLGNAKLSATIRLYQYKYRTKTGIPPVDKGMLMIYNVSNVKEYSTNNSIFDKDEAEKYMDGVAKYPLPLDFALPAFAWAVVYHDNKFSCMMRDIKPITSDTCSFLEKEWPVYKVKDDYVYGKVYLRKGDQIKIEHVSDDMLIDAAKLARKCTNTDTLNVAIFELDEVMKNKFSHETIEAAFNSLR